jgi:hypothetical protein
VILLVHELSSKGLKQKISITENNLNVLSVRHHVYKHNNPNGSLKLLLLDENEKTISESESILIIDISNAAYFHGYVRFNCNWQLKKETDYFIKLVGVGYSFSESAYIGVCNDFDLRKVDATYSPNDSFHAALDLELWAKTKIRRGFR